MDSVALLNNLLNKKNLSEKEISQFLEEVMNGSIPPTVVAAVLTALRAKGETSEEIIGLIKTMRKHMVSVSLPDAIDVCGTGGDGSNTFNISTAVSFVVAGAGVKVAKHGNRAASSKCGSADVLEALGVKIDLNPQQTEEVFKKVGMVFLFAPLFHPATKNVVLVRKELKVRTIFNVLGPLVNPAGVSRQLIGVPNHEIAEKLSLVAKKLSYKHLIIATSDDGMDEISTISKTTLFEIKKSILKKTVIDPGKFEFKKTQKKDLLGGSAVENAEIIKSILNSEKGPRRDIVLLNSAYALYIAGKVKTIKQGIKQAEKSLDSGNAKRVLENLMKESNKYA